MRRFFQKTIWVCTCLCFILESKPSWTIAQNGVSTAAKDWNEAISHLGLTSLRGEGSQKGEFSVSVFFFRNGTGSPNESGGD